ncbi:MAG: TonB-dependent receptor [candidate division WOR-3 bacterium]|nr:TonB-dependent receptor [candidate division WOR-3 bacterium]
MNAKKVGNLMKWLFAIPFFFSVSVFGGITGKVVGYVVDARIGKPLPGANIIVEGTQLGAATDTDGYYFIIGVTPGDYKVKSTMMGYEPMIKEGVSVSADLTVRVDFHLQETVIETDGITVTAERSLIQKDITGSMETVDRRDMKKVPVTDLSEAINLQTGVFFDPAPVEGGLRGSGRGEARSHIRGGDWDEVVWYVDGVRTAAISEARADMGLSYTQYNIDMIKQIQLLTGGFNAEYGNAQSGVVNVIMKEGGDNYTGSVEYIYGPPQQKHFGNYLYDPKAQKEFLDHTLPDGTVDTLWLTDKRKKNIYDYTDIPSSEVRFTLGGPFRGIPKMNFFLSGRSKKEAYALPHPRDTRDLYNISLNITWPIRVNKKLKASGFLSCEIHSSMMEQELPLQAKYYRGYGTIFNNDVYYLAFDWTHMVNPKLFYNIKLGRYYLKQKEFPGEYRAVKDDTTVTGTYDIWGDCYRYPGFDEEPFAGWGKTVLSRNEMSDYSLHTNLNWQVTKTHFLKAGFESWYNLYDEKQWTFSSEKDTVNPEADFLHRGLNEASHPIEVALYIQDKMEFEGFIANMGLRFDYFDGNKEWFDIPDTCHPMLNPYYNPDLDPEPDSSGFIDANGEYKFDYTRWPRKKFKPFWYLNPRIGVSYPWTENTMVFINYGHFFQKPSYSWMYPFLYYRPQKTTLNDRESWPRPTMFTLEPLKPEKAQVFEFGFNHNFRNLAFFSFRFYYKDQFDQTSAWRQFGDNAVKIQDPRLGDNWDWGGFGLSTYWSGDYSDSRGIEVNMKTFMSENISLDIKYSYSKVTEGRSTPTAVKIYSDETKEFIWETGEKGGHFAFDYERSHSRPHIFRTNLYLKTPNKWRGIKLISPLLAGCDASILYRYASGRAFTYVKTGDPPGTYDNYRYPAEQNVDLKASKNLSFGSVSSSLWLKVTNLFNRKNLRNFVCLTHREAELMGDEYLTFYNDAAKKYIEEGEVTTVDIWGYDMSFRTYGPPRYIEGGIRFNF